MWNRSWRRIGLFLLLTYALSSVFYVRIASVGRLQILPIFGLMWCPGIAALILRMVSQHNLRRTGWAWNRTRWQLLSYLIPPALSLAVYGVVWITGIGAWNVAGLTIGRQMSRLSAPATLAFLATIGFAQGAVFTLGEEIGWRGFLVPELSRVTSFTSTALISGVAWSLYHYPLILLADYNSGTPAWFAVPVFTWMVVASSFLYAWLRLKSGSLWTAVILHASHNLFIQGVFDRLTGDRGITRYVTTEFGIGLAIAYTAVAFYVWKRRGELPAAS